MAKDSFQNEINKTVREELTDLHNHADVANKEMGAIQLSVGIMQTDISYMKEEQKEQREMIEKVDSKTWWILGTLILGVLIEIGFLVFKK